MYKYVMRLATQSLIMAQKWKSCGFPLDPNFQEVLPVVRQLVDGLMDIR